MPIYVYRCPRCKKEVEIIQSIKELEDFDNDGRKMECLTCVNGMGPAIMHRQITTHGNRAFVPYLDENLTSSTDDSPKWVTSMAHRQKLMRDCGLEESNPRPRRKLKYKNLFFMGGKNGR